MIKLTWTLLINGVDYSDNYLKAEFTEKLNEPFTFELELFDIDHDDPNVQAGNIVKFQLNSTTVFKGRLEKPQYSDTGIVKCYGYDMSVKLLEKTYDGSWSATATSTIVSDLCSGVINVGTNTNYGNVDFSVHESRLLGLAKLARQIGYEWKVNQDASDNDQFNIAERVGNDTSQATFNTGGSLANCWDIKKMVDREALINKVKVLGMGDGTQQIDSGWRENTDSQSYYGITKEAIFIDRTIADVTSAQRLADQILDTYSGYEGTYPDGTPKPFYRISILPVETDYTFSVGDDVTVNDTRSGMSGEYKIVKKRVILNATKPNRLELELSNRVTTFLDKLARNEEQLQDLGSYKHGTDTGTADVSESDIAPALEGNAASHQHSPSESEVSPALEGNAASHDHSSYTSTHSHTVSATTTNIKGDSWMTDTNHTSDGSYSGLGSDWTDIASYTVDTSGYSENQKRRSTILVHEVEIVITSCPSPEYFEYKLESYSYGLGTRKIFLDNMGTTAIWKEISSMKPSEGETLYLRCRYTGTGTADFNYHLKTWWSTGHTHDIDTNTAEDASANVSATPNAPNLEGNAASHQHSPSESEVSPALEGNAASHQHSPVDAGHTH